MESITIRPIGVIHTGFPEKFGIPRQAGLVETPGYVVLEPPYNDINAVRGLEEFSHIWLIWQVSGALDKVESFSPTVRPPRLGGNTRVGVFASRSPFHPNAMGLSCVKLEHIEISETCGPILHISGADILDGTPLYDIKPYVKSGDLRPDAVCGFVDRIEDDSLQIDCSGADLIHIDKDIADKVKELIACDPRPRYQDDPNRVYGLRYDKYEIKFNVSGKKASVIDIQEI